MGVVFSSPLTEQSGQTEVRIFKDCEIIIGKKIGSGTFGTVYEARVGATKFALKLGNNSKEPLDKEIRLLKTFRHKHIVALKARCEGNGYFMEYMDNGSLYDLIYNHKDIEYSLDYVILWWKQLVRAISYVHKLGYIHCDLKPANFLMKLDYRCLKLADFGSATKVNFQRRQINGTIRYTAPEIHDGKPPGSFRLTKESKVIGIVTKCWELDNSKRPVVDEMKRVLAVLASTPKPQVEVTEADLSEALGLKHKLIEELKNVYEIDQLQKKKTCLEILINETLETLKNRRSGIASANNSQQTGRRS
ncbi:unnamed protein product [Enterobius vermicularis]|uniref:Protein kinase domain-containing protein n=1 Tax=Enterobius vermicularis TaxID=51028 RepID=A0A0N4UXU1_ENTVE|nr:unnamed protein product [Enterobius vermicularis]